MSKDIECSPNSRLDCPGDGDLVTQSNNSLANGLFPSTVSSKLGTGRSPPI
ncbi:hypothetical protein COCNU_11G003450 [Cocos nucifera]|uniref:Uncharacterized protein n=1 Tax=Cocos nucifera TaxID=13894 RepID=A0A8K0N959_COCNU|nr:hypothetical protein COCNU_11G003450 [Cocos nucifera]